MFNHLTPADANRASSAALVGAALGIYALAASHVMWDIVINGEVLILAPLLTASVASVGTLAVITWRKRR